LDLSNNPLLLKTLNPTVAVAMNGPRKGIQPRTFMDLDMAVPGPTVLYQIHYNIDHDGKYNTIAKCIANPKDSPDKGEFIRVAVDAVKGTFIVQVGTNGPQQRFDIQQPPPDLSQCTRIEIKWCEPVFDIAHSVPARAELFDAAESKYLESLRPTVLEDPQRIKALVDNISRARYRGVKGGVPRTPLVAQVRCYRGANLQESFTAYDPRLIILQGRWFDGVGFPGVWGLTPNEKTPELRPFILRADCANKADQLHGFFFGRQLDKEDYPGSTQWCDAIVQDDLASGHTREEAMGQFSCPAAGEGKCHYALNPDCKWNSAADVVLLFETKAGWNQHGGLELFTVDNHDPKGGCVVLNDGTVKFIRTEDELRQLRWK